MKKVILVAGGAGFIGSHLCERLSNDARNEIHCIDNLVTGHADNVPNSPNVQIHRLDVNTLKSNADLVDVKFDQVYNLACPASPVHYQRDPVFTWKTNVLGALNLLEIAERDGARFLQASTSEVYGEPLEHPQKETLWLHVNPVGVRSCYDVGKAAAETIVTDYGKQRGVNVRIVRIFNCYGPRMSLDDGRAVSNFVFQALRDEDITIYGDGSQTRSFCYVADLVDGLIKAMNSDLLRGPCNLGNPAESSVRDLATRITTVSGSKSKIIFKPLPRDDPTRRQPDIAMARELLHWEPKTILDAGLLATIADFRARLPKFADKTQGNDKVIEE